MQLTLFHPDGTTEEFEVTAWTVSNGVLSFSVSEFTEIYTTLPFKIVRSTIILTPLP